jgi:hypothetical protein
VVWFIATSAGVVALGAPGAPTGLALIDACWRFLAALVVTRLGASAPRWSWIVLTGIAASFAVGGSPMLVALSLMVLGAAIALALLGPRIAVAGAVVVGVGVQVLARLPETGPSGLTTGVALLAAGVVAVPAYRRAGPAARRRARRGALAAGTLVGAILVPVVVAAAITLRNGSRAAEASRAWLDSAAAGDQAAVLAHLAAAREAFAGTAEVTTAWYVQPGRALPIVGRQLEAISAVAGVGIEIVDAATRAAGVADIEQLRVEGGRIDVELLSSLRQPMHDAATVMSASLEKLDALDETWLLPFVRSRVDQFRAQVVDAGEDADLAAAALDVVPDMLGQSGPRRYLVLFTSPAETRELGGFMGNWGELTADGGRLELTRSGRAAELNAGSQLPPGRLPPLADPARYPERYLQYRPWTHWQNITGTPDFPTAAEMARELYPLASGGGAIDGVIYLDPHGLAALLRLTGDLVVEGYDQPLTADNVAEFLLRDQYVRFPETDARVDFLDRVSRETFERLTTGDLPGPRTVGSALGPAVDAGQIRFWTFDPAEQALLQRLHLDGAVSVPPSGEAPGDDRLLVTVANANPNKLDAYLRREVRYDVDLDPATGELEATVTIELHNDAPAGGSHYVAGNDYGYPTGSNRTYLSLYSRFPLVAASVDGAALPVELHEEYGWHRAGVHVVVPPQGTLTVTFTVRGLVDPDRYTLIVRSPALAHPDRVRVTVRRGDGEVPALTIAGPGVSGYARSDPGSAEFDLRGEAVVRVVGPLAAPAPTAGGP